MRTAQLGQASVETLVRDLDFLTQGLHPGTAGTDQASHLQARALRALEQLPRLLFAAHQLIVVASAQVRSIPGASEAGMDVASHVAAAELLARQYSSPNSQGEQTVLVWAEKAAG